MSSGGLAGSSFVGSLVNLFPGGRAGEGQGGQGEGSPASSACGASSRGLWGKLLGAPLRCGLASVPPSCGLHVQPSQEGVQGEMPPLG